MTNAARITNAAIDETPAELNELAAALATVPSQYVVTVQQAFNRVVESTKRRRRILSLVQDALGQLRLDMKYLVFDLEATRRERDAYKQQLNDRDSESDE